MSEEKRVVVASITDQMAFAERMSPGEVQRAVLALAERSVAQGGFLWAAGAFSVHRNEVRQETVCRWIQR